MSDIIKSILDSKTLPSPPGIAMRLLEIDNQPNVEIEDVAKIISADPVLTAKLIAYSNSPLAARPCPATNIRQAIIANGMRTTKILALSFSLVSTVSGTTKTFDYDMFWRRSLAGGVAAKMIASTLQKGAGDDEFLIGLMQHIGQIGLAHTFPQEYSALMQQSVQTQTSLLELEQQKWGMTHPQISVELLRQWKFPEKIIDQIDAYVATPAGERPQTECGCVLTLTQQITSSLFDGNLQPEKISAMQDVAEGWLDIDCQQLEKLFDEVTSNWVEFARLLNFKATEAITYEQLEATARQQVVELSMGLQAENAAIQRQNAELQFSANFDSLTGLKNRRAYDQQTDDEWERSLRKQRPFVMMMVDVDHFKKVNDTHGHAVGDLALVAIANLLKENSRQYDSVYRFGGEEFVVVLPETEPADAIAAANRFRETVEALEIEIPDGILKITISIGVAVEHDLEAGAPDRLLESADQLLYQAKQNGRNQVCCNAENVTQTAT